MTQATPPETDPTPPEFPVRSAAAAAGARADGTDDRPGLLFVARAPAPYRTHLLERIADEIPEYKLHSIFTHTVQTGHSWKFDLPDKINASRIAMGDEHAEEKWWKHPTRDFTKLRILKRYTDEHDIRACIIYGYTTHSLRGLFAHCHRRGIASFYLSDSNVKALPPRTWMHAAVKNAILPPLLRRCTAIFSMGEWGDQYFEHYGAPRSKMYRVPNEPKYEPIANVSPERVAALRAAWGLSADRKYILFIGRLIQLKRIDLLIEAFTQIADRRPDWDVVIVGDGPMQATWEAMVPEALASRFHWVGYRQMDEVTAAYHASHIVVLPSDREAWGLPVNEALAAGVPVITSDIVQAADDMVAGQGCGLLFKSCDAGAFAEALLEVSDDANYPAYRAATGPALERWRRIADPIDGIRAAMQAADLLPA